jgi:hypothetical protein
MLAKPGTMFIAQPDIPAPLAVDFPFPDTRGTDRNGKLGS